MWKRTISRRPPNNHGVDVHKIGIYFFFCLCVYRLQFVVEVLLGFLISRGISSSKLGVIGAFGRELSETVFNIWKTAKTRSSLRFTDFQQKFCFLIRVVTLKGIVIKTWNFHQIIILTFPRTRSVIFKLFCFFYITQKHLIWNKRHE